MKKLREEYQARRDSYLTELDDLRQGIDERLVVVLAFLAAFCKVECQLLAKDSLIYYRK